MSRYLAVLATVAYSDGHVPAGLLAEKLREAIRNCGGSLVADTGWTQDTSTIVDALNNPTDRGVQYGEVTILDLNDPS